MFTGIIQTTGTIQSFDKKKGEVIVRAQKTLGLKKGASIAVDGVCLTAERVRGKRFWVTVMEETIRVTTFHEREAGAVVNLEPSLRVGDPIDGHMVLGHVDGVGVIIGLRLLKSSTEITVRVPASLRSCCALKGSLAINGVSVTTASLRGRNAIISLTPYTLRETNLGAVQKGDTVNIEIDPIARYIRRLKKR